MCEGGVLKENEVNWPLGIRMRQRLDHKFHQHMMAFREKERIKNSPYNMQVVQCSEKHPQFSVKSSILYTQH